jgi:subtilisin family serine protease
MIKRFLLRGAFAAAFLIIATWISSAYGQKPVRFVPGQIIIKFNKSGPQTAALAMQTDLNATTKQRFESIGAELWEIKGVSVPDAVSRYKNDPRVAFVEPNYIVHTDDVFPNDPRFPEMWALHNIGQTGGTPDADIDAPEAWSIGTGGTVLVGIIDTGVDWHHPDLAANIFTNPGEIPANGVDDDGNGYVDDIHGWDFINNDNDPYDDNRHGTHVAGTIAAVGNDSLGVVGVSWSARILPIKFLDSEGYGSNADAILAVEYATRMGVRLTSNSWGGGGFSTALRDAIEEAGNQGILFIVAAGNDSGDNDDYPQYPASYDLDNIIAVASTDHTDALSWFSNYGLESVDVGAPGSDILSTFPNNSYGTLSGTSMATPHVSGAVSLVWAAAPTMTALEVKNAILSTVDPIPALAGRVVSGGRLNVNNLLASLDDVPPASVKNLAVQSTGSNSARLTWTATGDDSELGTATVYDLRYSKSGIYADNFNAAPRAAGTPHPAFTGSSESFEVTGLDFNTKYYFALVVEDEQGNRSPMSNLPNGTTLGVPRVKYSPRSFAAGLHTGGTKSRFVTVSNNAAGTLDFTGAAMPSWARLNPPSGRVNAGQSLRVEVIFDATGLSGGVHDSTLTLATNDPGQRAVVLPVSLDVTDAADIAARPTAFDFGVHYTGTCAPDTVVVTNIGTVALAVTSVGMSNPQFSTETGAFSLDPGRSHIFPIKFCPVSVGLITGTLAIQSNDPDHRTYAVSLRGEGLAPPIIAVAPSSLLADLFTGGVSNQTLSISNNGGSDLSFDLAIKDIGDPTALGAAHTVSGETPRGTSKDITPATGRQTRAPGTPSLSANRAGSRADKIETSKQPVTLSVSNLKVLLLRSADVYEIRDLLLSFPDISVVDEFDGEVATPALATLKNYDAVILIENYPLADPVAVGNVLADYVDEGGSVIMTIASFAGGWAVRGRFLADGYSPFTIAYPPWGYASLANYNATHPIMAGVTSAWGDLLSPTTLAPGAEWVADWDDGHPFIATQGHHVVGVNVFVAEYGYWGGDIPLILHNAVAWAARPDWLKIATKKGVIAAHSRLDIPATLNAAHLFGGNYAATLRITNNDPFNPVVVVPVAMHVTGAPDMAVSKLLMDYGPQFIGAAIKDTLVVSNEGTDQLTVSSISANHPEYTVDMTGFTLPPGASQNVLVTFAPTAVGPIAATLSITSNDHAEGVAEVELRGAGVEPPIISVTPTSLSEDLLTGGTATHTLTISNSGESALSFSIGGEDLGGPTSLAAGLTGSGRASGGNTPATTAGAIDAQRLVSVSVPGPKSVLTHDAIRLVPLANIQKGQCDTRSYPPMEHLNGGPDPFGYAWRDNDAPGGPKFDWIDVSGGSNIALSDDDFRTGIPLGFTFRYYGDEFTTIGVGSNGWLSFNGVNGWFPSDVPVGDGYAGAIAPYARDLYPPGGGYVRYQTFGAAPRRQFVIEYNSIPDYVFGNNKTFEVIFTEGTNAIRFQYLVAPNAPFGFGIESPDQTMGMGNAGMGDLFISPLLVRNNYAIEFAAMPRWLVADPTDAIVPPHSSVDIAVTFIAAGLFGGNYAANLRVINNDPLNSEVVVPVGLHVTGAPDIAVAPTSLTFDPLFIGKNVSKTLVVSNPGTDMLTVSSAVSSYPDYTVDTTSFTLAPRASQNVVVTFAPASAGALPATLRITSNDPDEGVVEVALTGTGVEPPIISVTPATLSVDLLTGETATRMLTIDNSAGGSDLIWSASVQAAAVGGVVLDACSVPGFGGAVSIKKDAHLVLTNVSTIAWGHVLPESGTVLAHSSAVVDANFDASFLYGGNYDARLVFTSNDPLTPEVVVPAHMHVTGAPDISLMPTHVDYGPVFTGQKVNKTLVVSNTGTDLLTVSSVSSDQADCTVDVTDFTLAPTATRNVVVSFAPTTAGAMIGDVTIASDDPDEGTLTVHVTGNGVEPPVIAVTPGELADTLSIGGTSTHHVTVSNRGASNLEISVTVFEDPQSEPLALVANGSGVSVHARASAGRDARSVAMSAVESAPAVTVGKGESDTRSYPPMDRASGGPDLFGYRWRDSNQLGGPKFNWIDVSGGTNIVLGDDDFVTGFPLGFTFSYYGRPFTTIGVGSNGWLSFNGSNMWFPGNVPARDNCMGAIAPFATDLFPSGGGYVRYATFGAAPHRQFVVEYNHISQYHGAVSHTFEVIFREGANSIQFQYLEVPWGYPQGFGIESPDETMGMGNNGVGDLFISPGVVSSNYAIEFAALPEWLIVTPVTATIPAGESLDLAALMDAKELEGGKYTGLISIGSNDPVTPVVPVYVTLRVDSSATLVTGVQAAEGVEPIDIPTRYELHANRPNPFNPVTTIAYDLPQSVNVRLVIYDVQGREVVELVSETQPAGRHEIVWDGRNASNETVASGVYFYRLVAADFVQTKKMVLLK